MEILAFLCLAAFVVVIFAINNDRSDPMCCHHCGLRITTPSTKSCSGCRPTKSFTPANGPKIPPMDKAGRNPPPPKSFMKPPPTPEPPPKKP